MSYCDICRDAYLGPCPEHRQPAPAHDQEHAESEGSGSEVGAESEQNGIGTSPIKVAAWEC